MTTLDAINLINKSDAKTLFKKDAKTAFRTLANLVHPDKAGTIVGQVVAADAFARLNQLYQEFNGKTDPFAAVKIGKWVVTGGLEHGDIADLYTTADEGVVLKVARSERDNDLIEAEANALKAVHSFKSSLGHYFPVFIDNFKVDRRRANVLMFPKGNFYTLNQILEIKGPLDFRHIVWMVNRLCSALGFMQQGPGYTHGAINRNHLLYNIDNHDMILLDFCYSVKHGEKIKAVVKDFKYSYPKEVIDKKPVDSAVDIYMLCQTFRHIAEKVPEPFIDLFNWCRAESPKVRPQDIFAFQDKWTEAAEQEYGKPKFVTLTI